MSIGIAGCAARPASAPQARTAASQPARVFDRPDLGVRLEWPDGWTERASADVVLLLTPHQKADDVKTPSSISLDIPKLPPHIPGLIPIGSVRNGYVDDLHRAAGAVLTEELPAPPIAAAAGRLVRSTWTDPQGAQHQETAFLLVHGDRVYILRARSAIADESVTRAGFDAVVRSLTWKSRR